jgi:hypothetical protein
VHGDVERDSETVDPRSQTYYLDPSELGGLGFRALVVVVRRVSISAGPHPSNLQKELSEWLML